VVCHHVNAGTANETADIIAKWQRKIHKDNNKSRPKQELKHKRNSNAMTILRWWHLPLCQDGLPGRVVSDVATAISTELAGEPSSGSTGRPRSRIYDLKAVWPNGQGRTMTYTTLQMRTRSQESCSGTATTNRYCIFHLNRACSICATHSRWTIVLVLVSQGVNSANCKLRDMTITVE
jgi:hypothetical protein